MSADENMPPAQGKRKQTSMGVGTDNLLVWISGVFRGAEIGEGGTAGPIEQESSTTYCLSKKSVNHAKYIAITFAKLDAFS